MPDPKTSDIVALKAKARSVIDRFKTRIRSLGARVHPEPILILGNQKSGTTAIAALLAEMTGTPASLDLKREMTDPLIDQLRNGKLSMADFVKINKLEFSRRIIKEPSLSLFYQELAEHFPQSTFVMVIRDPRDNIRSILNRLQVAGDLRSLTDAQWNTMSRAWKLIVDNRWLGLGGENYIEMLAHRWNFITDTYIKHADNILLSKYEEFLRDKVGEITRLAQALDLPPSYDIADKVDIQYQPAGDRSVRWEDFYGSENLKAIERICSARMTAMGYTLIF